MTEAEKSYIREHVQNKIPIPVVMESENFPISFWNDQENEFQGAAVEILGKVAELTGLQFKNVNTKDGLWSENVEALEKGEIALVSDLTRTKAREDRFIWATKPYATDYYTLVSLKEAPDAHILKISLSRIGIQKYSGAVDVYREWFPDSDNVSFFPHNLAALAALDKGEVDFVMMSRNTLLGMTNYLEKSGYRANLIFEHPIHMQFGFNKDEVLLASIVGKVQSLIAVDNIASRWASKTFD